VLRVRDEDIRVVPLVLIEETYHWPIGGPQLIMEMRIARQSDSRNEIEMGARKPASACRVVH
jgi:hypothetical protein